MCVCAANTLTVRDRIVNVNAPVAGHVPAGRAGQGSGLRGYKGSGTDNQGFVRRAGERRFAGFVFVKHGRANVTLSLSRNRPKSRHASQLTWLASTADTAPSQTPVQILCNAPPCRPTLAHTSGTVRGTLNGSARVRSFIRRGDDQKSGSFKNRTERLGKNVRHSR